MKIMDKHDYEQKIRINDRDVKCYSSKKMKELYPLIAKEYSTTAIRVERAIRHATEVAWNRSGAERFNYIFGKNLFGKYLRPTSSELICLLSDKITFG